jgi:integrase
VADVDGLTSRLLAKGLSPRTVAGARITLRKVLGDAVRDGLLHRNVAALSRPPRVETSEAKYLDSTQLRSLLEVAKTDDLIGPQVIISATTGIRQGELLGLDWADVDLTDRTLTVRQQLGRAVDGSRVLAPTKTQRSRRTIALPQVAVDALTALYEAQDGPVAPQGLIFRHPLGQPVDGVHMNHRFHRLLERAGLPDMGWHGLRHSAATALLTAGVPLDVVSRTLGHSSVAVTSDVYGHLVVERQQTAASAMDRVLLGG